MVETVSYDFFQEARYPVVWDYETRNGNFDPNDDIWYAHNTYYISSDYTIDEETLRIEPGTFVKFNDDTKISTSGMGKLIARGKPYLPIVFTHKNDEDNGEFIASGSFDTDSFEGLEIGDDSELEYCFIMWGGTGVKMTGWKRM